MLLQQSSWEIKENLNVAKNTLRNKSGSLKKQSVGKLFNYCAYSWQGFAEGLLQVVLFTGLCFKWSVKKHCIAKNLQRIWETFTYENNRNYNSHKFSYKFAFIIFSAFRRNQKQGSNFQQVDGLITRNISVLVSGPPFQRYVEFNRVL